MPESFCSQWLSNVADQCVSILVQFASDCFSVITAGDANLYSDQFVFSWAELSVT
jgi:hypothetical protein